MSRQVKTFEAWKAVLQIDCVAHGKLQAFEEIGEVVLRILYENGVDPTVEAIVRDGLPGKPTVSKVKCQTKLHRSSSAPYGRVGNEFRPMATRIEGWLQCENCGQNEMPLGPEFRCTCSKCGVPRSPTLPDSL